MTTVPPLATMLVRDRLTLTLYGFFVTWGWFLYGFGPAVPLIASEQGITRAQAGLHGTAMAVGTVASAFLAPMLAIRFGRRATALAGGGVVVLGVALLMLGTTLPITLTAALVAAVGGNLMLSAAQPALSVHHGPAGPAALTEANAAGATVGLLAPLAVGLTVALGWGWRPAVGVVMLLAVAAALALLVLPRAPSLGKGQATVRVPGAVGRAQRRFGPVFWLFLTALVCGVAVEFATTFWAADLVRDRTGAGDGLATAAVSALVAGMAASRFVVGPMSLRRAPEKLLLVGFVAAGGGWLVLWLATSPWVAILGLVLAGLGYGTHYPLALSLALRVAAARPDQGQARVAVGAGLAVALAPFVLGALADQVGSHRAFLLVPVLLAAGGVATALAHRRVRAAVAASRAAD